MVNPEANRLPVIIMISALCVGLGIVWYFVPHPAVIVALALVPLAGLFVLNKTFWLVLLFVVFSFFSLFANRGHNGQP